MYNNLANRYVAWMSHHRLSNIVLLLGYYLAVVLPHKKFGSFLNDVVFQGITRAQYNLYVLVIAVVALLVYAVIFYKNTRSQLHRDMLWGYLLANVIFAAILIKFLFVINIEIVHFPQYALFAILLFPLVGNFTGTLIWTTLAGIADESYQYFYLAPKDTSYYDMNDVVTNLVGAAFGLILLRSFAPGVRQKFIWRKSSIWFGLVGLGVIISIACAAGILSIYPSEETTYQLLRQWPPGFWSTVHPSVTYHVMRPLEGALVTIGLWIFFSGLDRDTSRDHCDEGS